MKTLQGKMPERDDGRLFDTDKFKLNHPGDPDKFRLAGARFVLSHEDQFLNPGDTITVQIPMAIEGKIGLMIESYGIIYTIQLEPTKEGNHTVVCNHCQKPILVNVDGRDAIPIVQAWVKEEITGTRMAELLEMWANGRNLANELPPL